MGYTQVQPDEDRLNYSKSKAEATLAYMFGGRVAEAIVFGDITSGASNDIERATEIARKMVCEWGMSDRLGPIAYESNSGPVFLGLQQSQDQHNYSEKVREDIDKEVKEIVDANYKLAKKVLEENRDKLEVLSQALLELETVDGAEINMILEGKQLDDIVQRRKDMEEKLAKEEI